MDVLGIGGPELLLLLFLAGVLLGPRRLAELAREAGKFIRQIQALTGNLTQQLNREIDLLEAAERKSSQSGQSEAPGAAAAGSAEDELPEASASGKIFRMKASWILCPTSPAAVVTGQARQVNSPGRKAQSRRVTSERRLRPRL